MLEIKNFTIEKEGKEIVSDASFSMKPKTTYVLFGENGSGKSTLLEGIIGYKESIVTGGSIHLNGKDITNESIMTRAKLGIFYSPQHVPNIEGVTLPQLLYRSQKTKESEGISILDVRRTLKEYVELFNLSPKILDADLGGSLSGGEKKQVELLSLLFYKPAFALLDEIDSGLDVGMIGSLAKILTYIQENFGTSVLLVTHNPLLIKSLGNITIFLIEKGSIVKTGGEELLVYKK